MADEFSPTNCERCKQFNGLIYAVPGRVDESSF
jgi:hypothetical protein